MQITKKIQVIRRDQRELKNEECKAKSNTPKRTENRIQQKQQQFNTNRNGKRIIVIKKFPQTRKEKERENNDKITTQERRKIEENKSNINTSVSLDTVQQKKEITELPEEEKKCEQQNQSKRNNNLNTNFYHFLIDFDGQDSSDDDEDEEDYPTENQSDMLILSFGLNFNDKISPKFNLDEKNIKQNHNHHDAEIYCSDDHPLCSICQDQIIRGDFVSALHCDHLYHKECISMWLKQKSTCPICNINIVNF